MRNKEATGGGVMFLPSMLNELLCIEITLFLTVLFLMHIQEISTMWYLAGIYLALLGFLLLRQEGDIFVGFLWVIDLGVGLIFFIFILHFANFLTQKVYFDIMSKSSVWSIALIGFFVKYFSLIAFPINSTEIRGGERGFFSSWYDYYDFLSLASVSDLGILKEIYFVNNSFEFILINFMLLYGIVTAITLSFWVKKILSRLHVSSSMTAETAIRSDATFFIRTQSLMSQQQQTTETRVWKKKKH